MIPAASLVLVLLLGAVRGEATSHDNVLVLLADDLGVESVGCYEDLGEPRGPTPWIDALAAHGVLFVNAYVEPLCSPTRSAILTGKHPFRTQIGQGVPWVKESGGVVEGAPDEVSLADALAATHRTYAVGKWHLSRSTAVGGMGYEHPLLYGFHEHRGPISNFLPLPGVGASYFEFEKNVADASGVRQEVVRRYATTDQVDDALDAIERAGDAPWFVWLAFNAPHAPFHVPPAELVTLVVTDDDSDSLKHRAAVEALDTEIGRLIGGIRPAVLARTWVVFLGDNGSPAVTLEALPGTAKGTGTELGVHVPLIVAGPRVRGPGRRVDALVGATDVYATICDMARVPVPPEAEDSVSFFDHLLDPGAPARRSTVFSQMFRPNGAGPYAVDDRTIRDARWKLRERTLTFPPVGFFHLPTDPLGLVTLLPGLSPQEQQAFDALAAALDEFGP